MSADIHQLTRAGPIAEIARVGYAPFEEDDPIEFVFADGAIFHVEVGFVGATDIRVEKGPLIEGAFGHLRTENPETFAAIARDWTREQMDLAWTIGETLSSPRRLTMTNPYRIEVGYVFRCGARELALFGESDVIFAAALDDPHIASFELEIGAQV